MYGVYLTLNAVVSRQRCRLRRCRFQATLSFGALSFAIYFSTRMPFNAFFRVPFYLKFGFPKAKYTTILLFSMVHLHALMVSYLLMLTATAACMPVLANRFVFLICIRLNKRACLSMLQGTKHANAYACWSCFLEFLSPYLRIGMPLHI